MPTDYPQVDWNESVADCCRTLAELAKAEDIGGGADWTTEWLVPGGAKAKANIVARRDGVVAGLPTIEIVAQVFEAGIETELATGDGTDIVAGQLVAALSGNARELLTCERTILNFLGRLSGIATLTREHVERVAATKAKVYDTRKTLPGWRLLEKYAVGQGGGCNHRLGLSEAVMIKDNHVALAADEGMTLAEAITRVRREQQSSHREMIVEVEVDTLEQLAVVLRERPDIVLLDNMLPATLEAAVALRNAAAPGVVLEASGGVNLETIATIASTGVDRISVGALTHSAVNFDFGLDWIGG